MVTTAKILSASFALAWAHTAGVVQMALDFLPKEVEALGAEVLLIAALLELGRRVVPRLWRFVKKANHAYDVLMDSADRHERTEDSIGEITGAVGRIEERLESGADRMERIEHRARATDDRLGAVEASLGVLADEDRLLIQRRLKAALPERRGPGDRRDAC